MAVLSGLILGKLRRGLQLWLILHLQVFRDAQQPPTAVLGVGGLAPCPWPDHLNFDQFSFGVLGQILLQEKFKALNNEQHQLEVAVVTTERAKHFYSPQDIPVTLYSDTDEWEMWKCRSDPVLHIHLRRWADLMLVAPLDANTLGKVASGICDNLLTCVIRAWDLRKPLLFCPAMNTAMWEHPITSQQVGQLKAFGYMEIPCVAKKLVWAPWLRWAPLWDRVKEVLSQHAGFQQS